MGKLQGKVGVITGGTEGIGLATSQLFVKGGAYVFITGRRQKELDEAATAIGSSVTGVQADRSTLLVFKQVRTVDGICRTLTCPQSSSDCKLF